MKYQLEDYIGMFLYTVIFLSWLYLLQINLVWHKETVCQSVQWNKGQPYLVDEDNTVYHMPVIFYRTGEARAGLHLCLVYKYNLFRRNLVDLYQEDNTNSKPIPLRSIR